MGRQNYAHKEKAENNMYIIWLRVNTKWDFSPTLCDLPVNAGDMLQNNWVK